MKCTVIIDKERDEVVIYTGERSELVEKIERLVSGDSLELVGTGERGESVIITPSEVTVFTVEGGYVWALLDKGRYRLRERLYTLEASLSEEFVKINKSALANIRKIREFGASIGGALTVVFKNGYRDYVSRRQIKEVKRRLSIK